MTTAVHIYMYYNMFSVHPLHVYLNTLSLGGIVRRTRPRRDCRTLVLRLTFNDLGLGTYKIWSYDIIMSYVHNATTDSLHPAQYLGRIYVHALYYIVLVSYVYRCHYMYMTYIGYIICMCTRVGVAIIFNDFENGFVYIYKRSESLCHVLRR